MQDGAGGMDLESAAAMLAAWEAGAGAEGGWQLATYDKFPVALVGGAGAEVWDAAGRRWWDLYGGHCVALLGHSHPTWAALIGAQARRLGFYSNVVYSPLRAAACEAVVRFAPSNLTKVFLSNSGAEANEAALKLARHHTGRPTVIAMRGGFHGRTLGALAVTASEKYRRYALPEYGNTRFVPFGEVPEIGEDVAAVILEPIQSLAGVATADRAYFAALREACDRAGALLIFDEVQTAWGRTGANFAADFYGVRVDLITSAKGAAGGFPVGVTLVDQAIAERAKPGDQGSTFGAGPMACAAILATHHVIQAEGLVARAAAFGAKARAVLPVPVRGEGALLGLCLDRPTKPVTAALRDRGFIVGGSDDPTVMRLMPPLVTPLHVLDDLAAALTEILSA